MNRPGWPMWSATEIPLDSKAPQATILCNAKFVGCDVRRISWAVERHHRAGGRGMARRVGLGPVFAFEWRMASRRWQAYAMRSLTVLLLLGAMAPVWYAWPAATIARQAEMNAVFHLWTAHDRSRAGRPGGAGGDGRGDLPGQGAGQPGPAVRHRPVRRRDRPGEARGAAGPGARDDPLRRPGAGDRDALRRRRPGRSDRGPARAALLRRSSAARWR